MAYMFGSIAIIVVFVFFVAVLPLSPSIFRGYELMVGNRIIGCEREYPNASFHFVLSQPFVCLAMTGLGFLLSENARNVLHAERVIRGLGQTVRRRFWKERGFSGGRRDGRSIAAMSERQL